MTDLKSFRRNAAVSLNILKAHCEREMQRRERELEIIASVCRGAYVPKRPIEPSDIFSVSGSYDGGS